MESLLSPILNIEGNLFYTLLYFAAGAILIFFGIKIIAQIEALGLLLFFIVLIIIFIRAYPLIKIEEFLLPPAKLDLSTLFLPYGPILFSLWGAALIPEVEEMLDKDKRLLSKIIPIATFIPIIIYMFFIYLVLGITASQTTESALTGLGDYLGDGIVSLALFLGVVTTFTSFIALGLTLKRVFWYDLGISKNISWLITCFPPSIIFLLGLKSFITVISLAGGVMLGVDGILILFMYQKFVQNRSEGLKNKKVWVLRLPLILIFVIVLILEIVYFLN